MLFFFFIYFVCVCVRLYVCLCVCLCVGGWGYTVFTSVRYALVSAWRCLINTLFFPQKTGFAISRKETIFM